MSSVRVLIADDQALMRSALATCLSERAGFHLVGEATNGAEAVELARRLRPEVVVMDIRMPVVDGVEATRRLTRDAQPPRVLMLTTFDLDEYVVEALRAGASGFLLKDATPDELAQAVRVVAAGDALLAPGVTRRLLDRFARRLPSSDAVDERVLRCLTARELDVLRLVARGLANAEIATELNLAVSSVKSHVSHLLTKFGKVDRVHLVVLAYESGLVQRRAL